MSEHTALWMLGVPAALAAGAGALLVLRGPGAPPAQQAPLDMPGWRSGDWAVAAESLGAGAFGIKGHPPREPEPWRPAAEELLLVAAEEEFLSYECFRLDVHPRSGGDLDVQLWLLRNNGAQIRLRLPPRSQVVPQGVFVQYPAPSIYPPFPVFPLAPGTVRQFQQGQMLRWHDGSLIRNEEHGLVYGGIQPATQEVGADPWAPGCLRVRVDSQARSEGCVMRWLPGKPWWVQAWAYRGDTGSRRWALGGTSWDTPPLAELQANLPDRIAEWKRGNPEVIRIPDGGRNLTSYTKAAQVAYSQGQRRVLLWFVPLRYDTVHDRASPDAAARTRTLHKAENYRVVLWQPPDTHELPPRLLQGLREALEAYPRASLDEYPLPKAGGGGKILEDEPQG